MLFCEVDCCSKSSQQSGWCDGRFFLRSWCRKQKTKIFCLPVLSPVFLLIFVKVRLQVQNTPELKAVQILNSADLNSVNLSLLDVFWKCKRWLDVPLVSRVSKSLQTSPESQTLRLGTKWSALICTQQSQPEPSLHRASPPLHPGRELAQAAAAAGLKFQFFVSILTLESVSLSGGWACKPPCGPHYRSHVTDCKIKTKNLKII